MYLYLYHRLWVQSGTFQPPVLLVAELWLLELDLQHLVEHQLPGQHSGLGQHSLRLVWGTVLYWATIPLRALYLVGVPGIYWGNIFKQRKLIDVLTLLVFLK